MHIKISEPFTIRNTNQENNEIYHTADFGTSKSKKKLPVFVYNLEKNMKIYRLK